MENVQNLGFVRRERNKHMLKFGVFISLSHSSLAAPNKLINNFIPNSHLSSFKNCKTTLFLFHILIFLSFMVVTLAGYGKLGSSKTHLPVFLILYLCLNLGFLIPSMLKTCCRVFENSVDELKMQFHIFENSIHEKLRKIN